MMLKHDTNITSYCYSGQIWDLTYEICAGERRQQLGDWWKPRVRTLSCSLQTKEVRGTYRHVIILWPAIAEVGIYVGLSATKLKHVAITLAAQFPTLSVTASVTDHFSSSLLPQRLHRAQKSFSKIQGAGGWDIKSWRYAQVPEK